SAALEITGAGAISYDDLEDDTNIITSTGVGEFATGLAITSTGDITDGNAGSVTVNVASDIISDGWYGLRATNAGTGDTSITTGNVTGIADAGIVAENSNANGGKITIIANGDVIGDYDQDNSVSGNDNTGTGIWAENNSTAFDADEVAIDITTNG